MIALKIACYLVTCFNKEIDKHMLFAILFHYNDFCAETPH